MVLLSLPYNQGWLVQETNRARSHTLSDVYSLALAGKPSDIQSF